MKRQLLQIALACTALLSFVAFDEGCALQGEGQRCSVLNNNADNTSNDCDTGLECISKNVLNTNSDICCPANGVTPTEKACIPGALAGNSSGTSSSSSSSSSGSTTTTTTTTATTGAGGSGGMGGAGGGM